MQTSFKAEQLRDPLFESSDDALTRCLQCAYCLPNCPTYKVLGDELDTPKGRVYLIRDMLHSEEQPDKETVEHIDRCLYCLACMSSCPSFVNFMHLMDHARQHIEENFRRPLSDRLLRWMLARILPYPGRFRIALRAARWVRPLAGMMTERLRNMIESSPHDSPPPSPNDRPQVFPADGQRIKRVALLTGCAQQALNTDINDATIRLLRRHGCEVVVAEGVGCCGALTHHMGKSGEGRVAATRNIKAWMKEVRGEGLDAIVINASGCGTMVKDYGHQFRKHELGKDAETISALAKDISEVLSEIELVYQFKPELRVMYHATCSLQFGQRIRYLPKKLLKAAGYTVLEPQESHLCCGSAGTYHLLQPGISRQLKDIKVKTLEVSGPDVIAAGNIGCMTQIASGTKIPVVHTVELLDWVTGGPVPRNLKNPLAASG